MTDRALIATRRGLFELIRSGGQWRIGPAGFLGDPVTMVLSDRRDGTLYAALNLGHFGVKLRRRDKGAAEWTEIAAPAYPPQPEDRKDETPWKLSVIWSLAAGGADQPGIPWAGTLPGGLFRSRDRGDSWELMRALWDRPERSEWFGGGYDLPGIHSICVDPRDSRHVLVADDQNIQDPHLIAQCSAAPDVFWCQHHNGIWRSSDGGKFWQAIGQNQQDKVPVSDFGFAVAAHPRDPEIAWFVPAAADQKRIPVDAALAVTRTRDGGKSFDVLRDGLPQKHCYDLIYRHGLAVADDGATVLMGSTTGGLWISENAGDAWQAISARLPPIYAVRFY